MKNLITCNKIMLKKVFFFFILLHSYHMGAERTYLLKLKTPFPLSSMTEPLIAFYKGKRITFYDYCTVIPEASMKTEFSILITPEISFISKGNTIRSMQRIENEPFLWYDISLKIHTAHHPLHNSPYYWAIQKLDAEKVPINIPDHTLIILMDPKLIKNIECLSASNDTCKSGTLFTPQALELPAITLHETVTIHDLNESNKHAQLAALPLRTIHAAAVQDLKQEACAIMGTCNRQR